MLVCLVAQPGDHPFMLDLPNDILGRACRIFLEMAYPAGEDTVPPKRRCFLNLPAGQALPELLQASADARAIYQSINDQAGEAQACAIRLGCADFPHLKLKVQKRLGSNPTEWIFLVDTHDTFNFPADHPDSSRWRGLQESNRRLKERIERAWEEAGLLTFNGMLRSGLRSTSDGPPA